MGGQYVTARRLLKCLDFKRAHFLRAWLHFKMIFNAAGWVGEVGHPGVGGGSAVGSRK